MNRSAAGGVITVSNGATLKIGGTNSFPSNYTTHTLGATSTVDYYGTNQTVTDENYGHLLLSTSGTKTLPATAVSIAGNFTMSGTPSATAASALTVGGVFMVGTGCTFGAASYSHSMAGNFVNDGTFTASTSTVTMNGSSGQTISGATATTLQPHAQQFERPHVEHQHLRERHTHAHERQDHDRIELDDHQLDRLGLAHQRTRGRELPEKRHGRLGHFADV